MINYLVGDATNPISSYCTSPDNKIIIHCCNNIGAWGSGFVVPLGAKYPKAESWYLSLSDLFRSKGEKIPLGIVQFVPVKESLWVANMIGQDGVRSKDNPSPIRYDAIDQCLSAVFNFAKENDAELHGPRFGSGLAGGDWKKIEKILFEKMEETNFDIGVTIYDLPRS